MIDYENKEVVREFLDETLSGFDTVEKAMIDLEKEPGNIDLINTIFRPVHSLKGNSAYFGLMKVKKLTHNLENMLDYARKDKLKIDSEIINVLLAGIDYLREMIERVENDEDEVIDEAEYNLRLKQIEEIVSRQEKAFTVFEHEKQEIINFIAGLRENLNDREQTRADEILAIFNKSQDSEETGEQVSEAADLAKMLTEPFESGEADEEQIETMAGLVKNLAPLCQDNDDAKSCYDDFLDTFETFAFSGVGIDEVGQEILNEKLTELNKYLQPPESEPKISQKEAEKEKSTPAEKKKPKPSQTENATIRISESSLDEFLNYVAELLSVEELFGYMARDLTQYDLALSSNFKQNMDDFSRISSKLRNGIMDIRKVKAANLLQKNQRIVRDIANNSQKEINVIISGDDLKIDKSYIELLDNPLVHMVRNAADHGIETTEDRKKKGKPEAGEIKISLFEDDKNVVLEVIDDGRGLDLEKLHEKAIEKGFIKKNQALEENDIINILFQSGISTAQEVTDVSGRGVGMDVVKTAIEAANGKILVETEKDKGSKFSIVLPKNVSTQINDVYLVKSFSEEVYALPLKYIEEAFTVNKEEIFSVKGQGNVVNRRENLLSVFILDEILGMKNKKLMNFFSSQTNIPFVYLNLPKHPLAVCIKDVIGVQTIVIKKIDNLNINTNIFDGAATLGDGKIALKINTDWLINYVSSK